MTKKEMRTALSVAAAVLATSSFVSVRAQADGVAGAGAGAPATAKWFVDIDGPGCAKDRSTFEREITLACEAMATCRITTSRQDAELEATLRCPSDSSLWSLDTRTSSGMILGTMSLTGATSEDRMREAAVEIARDAAPERTLATENLRNTLIGGRDDRERDRAAAARRRSWEERAVNDDTRVVVSAGVGTSTGFGGEATGYGGRLMGAYRLSVLSHVTLSVSGAMSTGEATRLDEWRRLRGGIGMGIGAPVSAKKFLGLLVEVGADGTQRYFPAERNGESFLAARTTTRGYAQLAGFLQFPIATYVRPYASLSATYLTDRTLLGGAEIGASFPLF